MIRFAGRSSSLKQSIFTRTSRLMSLLNRGVMLPWKLLKFCLFSRGINDLTVGKNGLSTYTTLHLCLSCGINITIEGRPLLGAPIGTQSFASDFIQEQIGQWEAEVKALYSVAKTQPQAAISCCLYSWLGGKVGLPLAGVWSLQWTALFFGGGDHARFCSCNMGRAVNVSDIERALLALPARMGGLGLPNPANDADV